MIAPRYVGPSTTTRSPRSRNDLQMSSSPSIAPLVITQLVLGRPPALQRLEPACHRVERAGQPARGRVLERARLARTGELREQRRRALPRERERVGKAACERDQVGDAEEAEDDRDALADVAARASGEELVPTTRLGRNRHSGDSSPSKRTARTPCSCAE